MGRAEDAPSSWQRDDGKNSIMWFFFFILFYFLLLSFFVGREISLLYLPAAWMSDEPQRERAERLIFAATHLKWVVSPSPSPSRFFSTRCDAPLD